MLWSLRGRSEIPSNSLAKDTPAACELRCHGPVQLGFVVNHSGKITRVTTGRVAVAVWDLGAIGKPQSDEFLSNACVAGTWAAENGLEAGDEEMWSICCVDCTGVVFVRPRRS